MRCWRSQARFWAWLWRARCWPRCRESFPPSFLSGSTSIWTATYWPFTCAVTIGTIAVFGLVPLLKSSRTDLEGLLREGSRGTPATSRLRRALIIGEVALSAVLLVCAGLLLKSLNRLERVDPGFQPRNVLVDSAVAFPARSGAAADRGRHRILPPGHRHHRARFREWLPWARPTGCRTRPIAPTAPATTWKCAAKGRSNAPIADPVR